MRIVYSKDDESVIGFNALGMRLRHEVCDKWLQEKKKIDEVIANLHQLNFDPEFFKKHEREIMMTYNQQTGKNISRKNRAFAFFN